MGVTRKELGRYDIGLDACILHFLHEAVNVCERELLCRLSILCSLCRVDTCVSTEYDDIEERVTHKSVLAVDTADCLTCNEEVLNIGHSVLADLDTAVLVVECGVDKDRLLTHIDAVLEVHTHHSGDSLLDSSLSVEKLYHRRVEPDTLTAVKCVNALALTALADNRGCANVTCLEGIHECFAVSVDKLCADGTYLLGNESTEDLGGICRTCGVVLKCVSVKERCTCSVSQYKSVCGCAVVVGCGEALIVHSSRAACCDDNSLSSCDKELLSLHIHKNRTCSLTVLVLDDLDRGCEINNGDLSVLNLVTENSHDLCARVVLTSVHTLSGCTAAVGGYHCSVSFLIEHNAQVVEPLDTYGSVVNQLINELGNILEVTAAHNVEVVLRGAIVRLIGRLDTALCHHCVSVAVTELCNDHYVCAVLMSHNSRSRACSATADYEHVNIVVDLCKVDICGLNSGVRLKYLCKLERNALALIGADYELCELRLDMVGMIFKKHLILLLGSHSAGVVSCKDLLKTRFTSCFHLFDGL